MFLLEFARGDKVQARDIRDIIPDILQVARAREHVLTK